MRERERERERETASALIIHIFLACLLFIPISAFAIGEKDIEAATATFDSLNLDLAVSAGEYSAQDPDLNSCGYMGETKISECSRVPADQNCPLGQCQIGGGGGEKHCAYWSPCTSTSCPKGSTCVDDIEGCNSYCSKYAKKRNQMQQY